MRFKILAISDTHLGEGISLLSFPHGRQHLWKILRSLAVKAPESGPEIDPDAWQKKPNKKLHVDELIMMGDIPDRALSSTSQIITDTNAFIRMLGSAVDVRKRGVYIPGNHDHTLWTEYVETKGKISGKDIHSDITPPRGKAVFDEGTIAWDEPQCGKVTHLLNLLTIFFGYPSGSVWRRVKKKSVFEFRVANPLYATRGGERTYVFTHGTHFKNVVASDKFEIRLLRWACNHLPTRWLIGDVKIHAKCKVRDHEMEDLEREVAGYVDDFWPSPDNEPTPKADNVWYLINIFRNHEERKPPPDSTIYSWDDLRKRESTSIREIDREDESICLWKDVFLRPMLNHLRDGNLPVDDITFVYGDTHHGGWCDYQLGSNYQSASKRSIRIFNCGGWTVHDKESHPRCNIFAVDEDDREYLIDVSYEGVSVGKENLVKLASKDLEHRISRIGKFALLFLKLIQTIIRARERRHKIHTI